jgi:hypothetical protein
MTKKYSSDKGMQSLFEGFRRSLKESELYDSTKMPPGMAIEGEALEIAKALINDYKVIDDELGMIMTTQRFTHPDREGYLYFGLLISYFKSYFSDIQKLAAAVENVMHGRQSITYQSSKGNQPLTKDNWNSAAELIKRYSGNSDTLKLEKYI